MTGEISSDNMSKAEDLKNYIEEYYKTARSSDLFYVIEHIYSKYKCISYFEEAAKNYCDAGGYTRLDKYAFVLSLTITSPGSKGYYFYIGLKNYDLINRLININFEKDIICSIIFRAVISSEESVISNFDWDNFIEKMEYEDLDFMIKDFINKNDKEFIVSKVKYSRISFFSKCWLLVSHGYIFELFGLVNYSIFGIKSNNKPAPSNEINADQTVSGFCSNDSCVMGYMYSMFFGK